MKSYRFGETNTKHDPKSYRFLVIGAHPDDCDLLAAGLAMKMLAKGHQVFFLSATDGSAGHQTMSCEALAERRAGECKKAGKILGLTYEALPIPDGELTADLPYRRMLMKHIREIAPDVILTHRTCDYHPDHRACGQLVMDCSYLVGVPLFCPEVPALRKAPVILSLWDHFTNPVPFRADICVSIDDVIERKIDATLSHVSQFYEWLPWIGGWEAVNNATTFEAKTELLRKQMHDRFARAAKLYPDKLPQGTQHAEAFEWNEYGGPLTDELIEVMTK